MTEARVRAIAATLVKEFHLSLDQVYDLTDYQIFAIYFHPRDEHGSIDIPGADDLSIHDNSYAAELAALFAIAKATNMDLRAVDELKQKLDTKYGIDGTSSQ